MTSDTFEPLPPEAELALAWSAPKVRAPLSIALHLDRRLARIVSRTTEPMLGQMRLTWWREALAKPIADRPRGDAVLDAVGKHWAAREAWLMSIIDGWEILVTAPKLEQNEAARFGASRGAFFGAFVPDASINVSARLALAGSRWALADAATAVSSEAERAALIASARALAPAAGRIPSEVRGLAVFEALAQRAINRGGRPLLEGRGASLAALRGAIFRN
ncbi:squalene/phytoene synthase family protein [Erythrobacter sp. R86502]|uniref:squalene/phytoene synthase family protein n=1 Tax=Erythrobacter sp. R86502 TaxID=3093846 RepID=UPI0036D27129